MLQDHHLPACASIAIHTCRGRKNRCGSQPLLQGQPLGRAKTHAYHAGQYF